jgi:phage baseplate assembly protein W
VTADRAWRFIHPHLDRDAGTPGLVISPTGAIGMVDGPDAVRQSLLLLLTTRPGERVMRPSYGCPLHRLIFSPNDHTTAGLAMHYVRQAIERWEPRVEILRVTAEQADEDPERLHVGLDYEVRATRQRDTIVVPVDLTAASSP